MSDTFVDNDDVEGTENFRGGGGTVDEDGGKEGSLARGGGGTGREDDFRPGPSIGLAAWGMVMYEGIDMAGVFLTGASRVVQLSSALQVSSSLMIQSNSESRDLMMLDSR